ncbi:MAG: YbaY family lipoprotein [Desulfobacterales bacterium]
MFKLVSIFIGASLLSACFGISTANGGKDAASPRVTGTVTYLERVALPPTAVIKVQLVDVSRADAPAVALGEQIISTGGKQVPFFFEIPYDPAKIEANHTYAVQARIEEDGRLRFINDQRYSVITRNAPMHVDMVLRPVNS